MTSKPVKVWVLITELHYLVEQKSKQTAIDDRPELMSSPINNPAYPDRMLETIQVFLMLYQLWKYGVQGCVNASSYFRTMTLC